MSAPLSPSGEVGRPSRALIAVVVATLALRLALGATVHLTEDEAYYRLWSMAPAFGYYDHPPMIAWWIGLGRALAGDDALGVRLLPIFATAATSLLVWDLARLAGASPATASRAGVWFNAMLLVLAGGFLAVPDAPAAFFWTLTVDAALRAARARSAAWWAAAGAAAGLACLAKYSALFIAPGMVLWLVSSRERRAMLKTPGPWLAAVIAIAIFSVNVAWNAQHDWLTFARQFGRVAPHRFAPGYLAELIGGQIFLMNPLIALFAGLALFRPRRTGVDLAAFLALSAPFAAYLLVHSLHDRVQAHWPAPLYPMLAVCAAAEARRAGPLFAGLARAVPVLGFGLGAAALIMLATPGRSLGRLDLALPVRGWTPFAARLESLRRSNGAAWVGTTSYGLASELALEAPLRAPVVQIAERGRWRGLGTPRPDMAAGGLVVDLARRLNRADLQPCFSVVRPLGQITRGDPGERGKSYAAFAVSGPTRDVLSEGC